MSCTATILPASPMAFRLQRHIMQTIRVGWLNVQLPRIVGPRKAPKVVEALDAHSASLFCPLWRFECARDYSLLIDLITFMQSKLSFMASQSTQRLFNPLRRYSFSAFLGWMCNYTWLIGIKTLSFPLVTFILLAHKHVQLWFKFTCTTISHS